MGNDEHASPASEAWSLIWQVFSTREVHGRLHAACDELGLTPPLAKALSFLDLEEGKPMRVLAEEWACDASYVTSVVDGLEERGIAERRVHPTDRRVKAVGLTPVGVKVRDRLQEIMSQPPSGFRTLSESEHRRLRDMMRKVIAAMET